MKHVLLSVFCILTATSATAADSATATDPWAEFHEYLDESTAKEEMISLGHRPGRTLTRRILERTFELRYDEIEEFSITSLRKVRGSLIDRAKRSGLVSWHSPWFHFNARASIDSKWYHFYDCRMRFNRNLVLWPSKYSDYLELNVCPSKEDQSRRLEDVRFGVSGLPASSIEDIEIL